MASGQRENLAHRQGDSGTQPEAGPVGSYHALLSPGLIEHCDMSAAKIKARALTAWCALLCSMAWAPTSAAVKLKDLARVDGSQDVMILGYGLVVGLSGTG